MGVPTRGPGAPEVIRNLALLFAMGCAFGFLFERSHVYEPTIIREQFVFQRWVMLKMFMGAVAGACLAYTFWMDFEPERFATARRHNLTCKTHAHVCFGATMLGVGMCVAGACPGMVLPQMGTGVENAWVTFCGCLAGAAFHNATKAMFASALFEDQFPGFVGFVNAKCGRSVEVGMREEYLDLRFNLPLKPLMIGFGVFAAAFSTALEFIVPYKNELIWHSAGTWHDKAWPPSLCGLGIGLLNFLSIYTVHQSIGSSTGYANVTGDVRLLAPVAPAGDVSPDVKVIVVGKVAPTDESADGKDGGVNTVNGEDNSVVTRVFAKFWQVPYLATAIFGAYASAQMCDNFPSKTPPIGRKYEAFLGGFLMLLGSRIASGCTSGHGIAGMPMMNISSILGVAFMFGGGIVVGTVMYHMGDLILKAA